MTLPAGGGAVLLSGDLAARVRGQLAAGLVGSLQPLGADVQLSDWASVDASGLGDRASLTSFRYRTTPLAGAEAGPLAATLPAQGEGAFALFSRGDLLSALVVFGTDSQVLQDARQYAARVDARLQAQGPTNR